MAGPVQKFFSAIFVDPFKTFIYTYKLINKFRKEARNIDFSVEEEKKIYEYIRKKAHELLLEDIKGYGVEVITDKVC